MGYTIIADEDTIGPAAERFPLRVELLSHIKRRRRAALFHGNTPAEPHGHPAHKHPPQPPATEHPLQFLTGKNGNPPPPLSTLSKLFGNSVNSKGSPAGPGQTRRYSEIPISVEKNPGPNSRPNTSPGNYEAMLMKMFDRWYSNRFGTPKPEPAQSTSSAYTAYRMTPVIIKPANLPAQELVPTSVKKKKSALLTTTYTKAAHTNAATTHTAANKATTNHIETPELPIGLFSRPYAGNNPIRPSPKRYQPRYHPQTNLPRVHSHVTHRHAQHPARNYKDIRPQVVQFSPYGNSPSVQISRPKTTPKKTIPERTTKFSKSKPMYHQHLHSTPRPHSHPHSVIRHTPMPSSQVPPQLIDFKFHPHKQLNQELRETVISKRPSTKTTITTKRVTEQRLHWINPWEKTTTPTPTSAITTLAQKQSRYWFHSDTKPSTKPSEVKPKVQSSSDKANRRWYQNEYVKQDVLTTKPVKSKSLSLEQLVSRPQIKPSLNRYEQTQTKSRNHGVAESRTNLIANPKANPNTQATKQAIFRKTSYSDFIPRHKAAVTGSNVRKSQTIKESKQKSDSNLKIHRPNNSKPKTLKAKLTIYRKSNRVHIPVEKVKAAFSRKSTTAEINNEPIIIKEIAAEKANAAHAAAEAAILAAQKKHKLYIQSLYSKLKHKHNNNPSTVNAVKHRNHNNQHNNRQIKPHIIIPTTKSTTTTTTTTPTTTTPTTTTQPTTTTTPTTTKPTTTTPTTTTTTTTERPALRTLQHKTIYINEYSRRALNIISFTPLPPLHTPSSSKTMITSSPLPPVTSQSTTTSSPKAVKKPIFIKPLPYQSLPKTLNLSLGHQSSPYAVPISLEMQNAYHSQPLSLSPYGPQPLPSLQSHIPSSHDMSLYPPMQPLQPLQQLSSIQQLSPYHSYPVQTMQFNNQQPMYSDVDHADATMHVQPIQMQTNYKTQATVPPKTKIPPPSPPSPATEPYTANQVQPDTTAPPKMTVMPTTATYAAPAVVNEIVTIAAATTSTPAPNAEPTEGAIEEPIAEPAMTAEPNGEEVIITTPPIPIEEPEQLAVLTTTVAPSSSVPLTDTNMLPAKANAISKTSSTLTYNNEPPIVPPISGAGTADQSAAAKANAVHSAAEARVLIAQRAHRQYIVQQALNHKNVPAQTSYSHAETNNKSNNKNMSIIKTYKSFPNSNKISNILISEKHETGQKKSTVLSKGGHIFDYGYNSGVLNKNMPATVYVSPYIPNKPKTLIKVSPYAPPPAAANPTEATPKPASASFNKDAFMADLMKRIRNEFFTTTKPPVAKPKIKQPAAPKPAPVEPEPVDPTPPVEPAQPEPPVEAAQPAPPAEVGFPEEPAPPAKPAPPVKPKYVKVTVAKKPAAPPTVTEAPAAPPATEAPPPPEPTPAPRTVVDPDQLADINEARVDQGLPMLLPHQVDVHGNILPPKPKPMFNRGNPIGFGNNIEATHHAAHIQAGHMDHETHRQLHRILRIRGNAKIQQQRQYEQQQMYNVANNLYRLQQQQQQYPHRQQQYPGLYLPQQHLQQQHNHYIPRTQANGRPMTPDVLADLMEARANAARARRPVT